MGFGEGDRLAEKLFCGVVDDGVVTGEAVCAEAIGAKKPRATTIMEFSILSPLLTK